MRWLVSLALCASFLPALSWAQVPSSSSTESSQAASGVSSSSPNATWERLDDLLNQLERSAEDSSADSERLEASLRDARSSLTELSTKLSESQTQVSELSSSLTLCARSLELSETSLKEAKALAARNELELRFWKGAAFVGLALGLGGVTLGLILASR
jgi:hypothetical protein